MPKEKSFTIYDALDTAANIDSHLPQKILSLTSPSQTLELPEPMPSPQVISSALVQQRIEIDFTEDFFSHFR